MKIASAGHFRRLDRQRDSHRRKDHARVARSVAIRRCGGAKVHREHFGVIQAIAMPKCASRWFSGVEKSDRGGPNGLMVSCERGFGRPSGSVRQWRISL